MDADTQPITGRRLLLVEDDYFIATNMQNEFEHAGAQVLGPVPSVRAALALIDATPDIDAAVLDINVQEEMVFPVADALEARGVPFVFATGYERTVIPQRFAHVRHHEKPVEPAQLIHMLRDLAARI
ncbi:response regulator [Methylobacterium gossipiicola]|uniref:CheY chemotaxis protein or a CheY-like REC (Receiver) domain n=1 Tax=Methylobacterium gossipiicola TaxID=582675 RepID=A0A1I2VMD8_9HYPH|nr:response regulator [Methylobacterium gossipiicola]SFG89417.1 CheY chemotaxis protein or a CheY-like REC (receiver) domain [Methylobacterium gossipiicola]